MSSRILFLLSVFSLLCLASTQANDASDLQFKDLEGRTHTPLKSPACKATVLFFVLPDCPISNAYAPEIKRIADEFSKKNVALFVVYVEPDMSIEAARKHAGEYGFDFPVLRDTRLELVELTGVTIAPEVAVLSPDGTRLYRGRIDNMYAALGKRRTKTTEFDLRDALNAILDHKPVPNETTKPIGCYINKPKTKTKKSESEASPK